MAKVTPIEDLRLSATAALFEGRDDIPVSIFVTRYQAGQGPDLHFHPYAEAFVVEAGSAKFTVGDGEIEAGAGNIVVVPPETVHGFKCVGDDELRVVSVHPSPTVQQTNL